MVLRETQSSFIKVENDLAIRIVIEVHKAFFGFAQQSLQFVSGAGRFFTITDEHIGLAAGVEGSPEATGIVVVVFVEKDVSDDQDAAGVSVIGVGVLMIGCVSHFFSSYVIDCFHISIISHFAPLCTQKSEKKCTFYKPLVIKHLKAHFNKWG